MTESPNQPSHEGTPRTDAAEFRVQVYADESPHSEIVEMPVVDALLARQLERELAAQLMALQAANSAVVALQDELARLTRELSETKAEVQRAWAEIAALRLLGARAETAEAERDEALRKLNTPELHDFAAAVVMEAAHQRERWGVEHDEGKAASDWFWLLGYLGGKAIQADKAGDRDKLLHHIITTAAACANWHANASGQNTAMRPGIAEPKV